MNAIQMRTIRHRSRSLLVVALGLALAASTAIGQPKKDNKSPPAKGAPAGKGGAPGKGGTAPAGKGGTASPGGAGKGSGATGDEGIEIDEPKEGAGGKKDDGTI